MSEDECWRQDEVVCPYCGHKHRDSWELEGDSGEAQCDKCDREFWYEREIEISYTTRRIESEEE